MDQSVTNQFRAALTFLLKKEGRGAQTRLAKKKKIDRGYLSAIVKGRRSCSDKVRSDIAAYFGMDFEEMLGLGRRIVNGEEETLSKQYTDKENVSEWDNLLDAGDKKWNPEVIDLPGSGERIINIPEKLAKTYAVLEAGGGYADLLASLLDAFQDSVNTKRENLKLRDVVQKLNIENAKLKDQLSNPLSRMEGQVNGDTKS